jgi:hypothetical protein
VDGIRSDNAVASLSRQDANFLQYKVYHSCFRVLLLSTSMCSILSHVPLEPRQRYYETWTASHIQDELLHRRQSWRSKVRKRDLISLLLQSDERERASSGIVDLPRPQKNYYFLTPPDYGEPINLASPAFQAQYPRMPLDEGADREQSYIWDMTSETDRGKIYQTWTVRMMKEELDKRDYEHYYIHDK